MSPRLIAITQALFVVFLWATSWVFIKIGLQDIPPVTFAGLRYFFAFICLLIVLRFNKSKSDIRQLSKAAWIRLIILGIFLFAITQGAVFVALAYLPAITVNLLWSFSSVMVAIFGTIWLSERTSLLQWLGIVLAVFGTFLYFYPVDIHKSQSFGILIAILGVLANAVASILGRDINRSGLYHPLVVSVISMGAGSVILLFAGIVSEGPPTINLQGWGIIFWLALVNTAFAFTLWNHTLRTLSAVESSIINGTMLIWIPILAVIFLGETIIAKEIIGLVITGLGTLIVQLRKNPSKDNLD